MPIGIIINALSIVIGGILGAFVGHKLSPKFKEDITLVFGVCSMGMGISTIGLMENMPAVILAMGLGTALGTCDSSWRKDQCRCRCYAACDRQIYQEFKFRAF